jgi:tetratricopeptide (TPR) repeat protein
LSEKYSYYFCKGVFLLYRQWSFNEAGNCFDKCIFIAKTLENNRLLATSSVYSAHSKILADELAVGVELCGKALEFFKKANDEEGRVYTLYVMARALVREGKFRDAINLLDPLIETSEVNSTIQLQLFSIMCTSYLGLDLYAKAEEMFFKCDEVCQLLGNTDDSSRFQIIIFLEKGYYEKAINLIEKTKEFISFQDSPNYESYLDLCKGLARLRQGIYSEATELIEKSYFLIEKNGVNNVLPFSLRYMSKLYILKKDFQKAEVFIALYEKFLEHVKDMHHKTILFELKATYFNLIGDTASAQQYAEKTIQNAKKYELSAHMGFGLIELAYTKKIYSPLESIDLAKQAVDIFQNIKSGDLWWAYWSLAKIQLSVSAKFVSQEEIVKTLSKTVVLLDRIRKEISAGQIESVNRFNESTKTFSEPAKQLAQIYKSQNRISEYKELVESWNLID